MSDQPSVTPAAVPNGSGLPRPAAAPPTATPGAAAPTATPEAAATPGAAVVPAQEVIAPALVEAPAPAETPAQTVQAEVPAPVAPTMPAVPAAPAPAPVKSPAPTPAVTPKSNFALVIDDEPANRDFLVRLLQQAKLDVRGASTAAEALKIAEGITDMALVVIDNKLPDMDGVDLLIQFRPRYPEARMIMATMLDERQIMVKAFENGCDVFLVKPHGFMELFRRLQAPDVPGEPKLSRLIIDQYGPRPYRG